MINCVVNVGWIVEYETYRNFVGRVVFGVAWGAGVDVGSVACAGCWFGGGRLSRCANSSVCCWCRRELVSLRMVAGASEEAGCGYALVLGGVATASRAGIRVAVAERGAGNCGWREVLEIVGVIGGGSVYPRQMCV